MLFLEIYVMKILKKLDREIWPSIDTDTILFYGVVILH
jgi:hypothetical protein